MLPILRLLRAVIACFLILTQVAAFSAPAATVTPGRGTLLESSLIASYSKEELNANFKSLGLAARNGIKVFRVSYQSAFSSDVERPIVASGLIIVPDVSAISLPWISLQHGTVASRTGAPSLRPREGLYEASQGFVTSVMDYIGYGSSESAFHPYLIAGAYVPAGVDLLRATRALAAQRALHLGQLFLRGYSEGGYATLALQKALETEYPEEFTVTASAPAAGPYDLEKASQIILSRPLVNPVFSTFAVLAYHEWLAPEMDLETIFAIRSDHLKSLFTEATSASDIQEALPVQKTNRLMKDSFLKDFLSPAPQTDSGRLMRRLLVGQSLNRDSWVPSTTTRFYHCREDEIVPVEAAESTLAHFKALNAHAPVSSIFATSPDGSRPYTHSSCPLLFSSVSWFRELLQP